MNLILLNVEIIESNGFFEIVLGVEKVKRNQNSVSNTLEQCASAEKMGSAIVEQALNTCESTLTHLSDLWQEVTILIEVLNNLPKRLRLSVSPIKNQKEITQLQETHKSNYSDF